MVKPDVSFDGKYYSAPYSVSDFPQISPGYLPSNVHVHIDFGRHNVRGDYAPTQAKISGCDIYIPEVAGHTPELEQVTNELAQLDPGGSGMLAQTLAAMDDYDPSSFEAAELEAISGSRKEILFVDGSSEDTTTPDEDATAVKRRFAAGFATFDEALLYMYEREYAATYDRATRDRVIVRDLGPKIGQLISRTPQLQRKPEVFVLMRLGARHYPVFDALQQSPHTRGQVSAETVNHRTQLAIVNRAEENVSQRIGNNQRVSKQLILAQYIANMAHELIAVDETDIKRQTEGTAIRNIFTQMLIASHPLESALLLGQMLNGQATLEDQLVVADFYKRAQTIYENPVPAAAANPMTRRKRVMTLLRGNR